MSHAGDAYSAALPAARRDAAGMLVAIARGMPARWVTLCLVTLFGCSDATESPARGASASSGAGGSGGDRGSGGGGTDTAGGSGGAAIEWSACPLYSDGGGTDATCASVAVPLDWSADTGGIEIFVKRVAGAAPTERHLWMLNGGPGGPGADFESVAELLVAEDTALAVYLPDHRGTGRSARLGCEVQEADDSEGGLTITESEWPACREAVVAQWGADLASFSTTNAARDIAHLVGLTSVPGVPTTVFGGSYGTFWAQRYLQLAPAQASGVVLVGIAPPTLSFAEYDALFDGVGRDYLAACGADAFCAAKLGADPAAAVDALFAQLDAGHCPDAGLDRGALRRAFAGLVFYNWYERPIVPAVAYRLARCDVADVAALQQFGALLGATSPPDVYDRLQGVVLGMHIGLSELWPAPSPPQPELDAVIAGALFSTEMGTRLGAQWEAWPRYQPDALDGTWAVTSVPMLMLNGTLDPATPLGPAATVGAHFAGSGQQFLAIPGASHSFVSPWPGGQLCMIDLLQGFARDLGAVDTTCAGLVDALAFEGSAELALAVFGTGDLWENAAPAAADAAETGGDAAETAGIEATRATLRRALRRSPLR